MAVTVPTQQAKDLLSPNANENAQKSVANSISDRLSKEIIIALVGPIGSGVSATAKHIKEHLEIHYKYTVPPIIKISDFIRYEAYRVGVEIPDKSSLDTYINAMQNAGNELREKYGANYLAEKTIEQIVKFRTDNNLYVMSGGKRALLPARMAFVIDSIKNIEELSFLKQIYGNTLILFGVFAPDSLRKDRLVDLGAIEGSVKQITDRDQADVPTFGQMTRKIFVESDFFICNDQTKEVLHKEIERFLSITFNAEVHTPTRAESAMYEAEAAAAKSACMSRQVGAAIISEKGELIGVGWNDVPKFGGGLYNEDDRAVTVVGDDKKIKVVDKDKRCFNHKGGICHNETKRHRIIEKISDLLDGRGFLKKGKSKENVKALLKGTDVDYIIEYSRSIHAEMEAILSVAREGKHSLVRSTLYTNTYPCHNCARHIVASGIKEVVYIQPYLKSLAIELHGDAISEVRNDSERVIFRQYDGVAPKNYHKLFKPDSDRKSGGRLIRVNPWDALPVFRVALDAFVDYEDKVIADLSLKEQNKPNVGVQKPNPTTGGKDEQ